MANTPVSVLTADDEQPFLDLLTATLEREGYFVKAVHDGMEALAALQDLPFDLAVLDINMPRLNGVEVLKYIRESSPDTQVIMLTGISDVSTAVDCMRRGAYHYITKPYSTPELLAVIDRALERKRLLRLNKVLKSELARRALSMNVITQDRAFLEVIKLAERAAPSDSTVLIQGESGTGKELIANFLHANSKRKEEPFLALNCSSIPETLIESELFGHEKGAFTDAVEAKQGLVEISHGGTLFLDEIREIPKTVQPKILRFLQTGEFRRVGGNRNLKADVRVISATNKDLRRETAEGRFREDLLYRINVITLQIPPLRERKNDMSLLANHFLMRRSRVERIKHLEEEALEVLMKYDWPGNVRELENVMERAAVLCEGDVIRVDDLALPPGRKSMFDSVRPASADIVRAGSPISLVAMQKAHVEGVLNSVNWDKAIAAKILGVSVKTLYAKIQSFGLAQKP